jgi:hypothetical protein
MTVTEGIELFKNAGSLGGLILLVYWMLGHQKEISLNTKAQVEAIANAMTSQMKTLVEGQNVLMYDINQRHEKQVGELHATYEKKLEILTASYERQMLSIATSFSKSMDQMMSLLKDSQNSNQELSKQSVSAITKQGSTKKNES